MRMDTRTIYYDGLCQLCSREIAIFQQRVRDGSLAYVDISDESFVPANHGLDAVQIHRTMHVQMEDGRIVTGMDALIAMWEFVPGFRWLAALSRFPIFRPFAEVGYSAFAYLRPKFPKRKRSDCRSGHCPSQ